MEKIVIFSVFILALLSCKTVEKSSSSATGSKESYTTSMSERVSETVETFGDTLYGIVPIRPVGKIPQVIRVRSSGIELELSVTDTSVTYRAVARPVARSTLSYASTADTDTVVEESKTADTKVTKKGFQLPWWIYVVGIGVLVLVVLNKFYNPFKRF